MSIVGRAVTVPSIVLVLVGLAACESGPPSTFLGVPDPSRSAPPAAVESAAPSVGANPTDRPVQVTRGLQYVDSDPDGTFLGLKLDLYVPHAAAPPPVVVFIHGGGWVGGSREDCLPGQFVNAEYLGYAVACIDYRLATEDCDPHRHWPGAVRDVRSSVDWLRANAVEYGLDPDRIALVGDSSGGHLAALTGLSYGVEKLSSPDAPSSAPVQAIVDWYGPADLLADAIQFEDSPCETSLEALQEKYGENIYATWYWTLFLGGGLGDPAIIKRARLAAPGRYADPSDPPVLVIHGEADPIVPIRQSELLVERLQGGGVDVTFLRLPGFEHSYFPRSGDLGEDRIAGEIFEPTREFLDRVLGRES